MLAPLLRPGPAAPPSPLARPGPADMRPEYDIRGGVRGKYYTDYTTSSTANTIVVRWTFTTS